jgi:uncharacterized protein YbaP (TraB family)
MSRRLVFIALLLSACATAQQRQTQASLWGSAPSDRAMGPLLFVLEASGGSPVYLFGTMHTEPVTSMPPIATAHFAQARTVAFEADMENLEPAKLLVKAMLPADQSLDKLVGPEVWQRLQDSLGSTIPPQALVRFRPWLVCTLILQKSMGATPGGEVMDLSLLKRSRAESKTVKFLETMDQQIEALEKLMDAAMLVELSKETAELSPMFASMAEAYRAGDIAQLEALTQLASQSGDSAARMRDLLGVRNERWIPFVEQMATQGGGFIAFGAAHLPGEDGVVALLRRRGHEVTRVLAP